MPKKTPIKSFFVGKNIYTDESGRAIELYNRSRFGVIKNRKVFLSLLEGLYLTEKGKIEVYDGRNKQIDFEQVMKRARKLEKDIFVRYPVFRELRDRGYVVKTALKFGADFRVYDRGVKPGEDHAKWVVFAVHESDKLTWFEFAAKSRVAHSTRKKLLIGIVDAEEDVTFYEASWIRP